MNAIGDVVSQFARTVRNALSHTFPLGETSKGCNVFDQKNLRADNFDYIQERPDEALRGSSGSIFPATENP